MANGTLAASQLEMLSQSGTGIMTIVPPATNTNQTLTLPDVTGTVSTLNMGTAVASTSGTSIDFTGIPAGVKRITVMFSGMSTNGTSIPVVQLGDSGGFETTGYAGSADIFATTLTASLFSGSGFQPSDSWAAAHVFSGQLVLTQLSSNVWVGSFNGALTNSAGLLFAAGTKTLSDTLTQVRITMVNGTDAFDAGSINIMYEG
jgi:hypothetical protein